MIMNTPKISIIVPIYNVEKYLAECLDSVVNQTLRETQIICVNDGSTDGSCAILQEYADRDSRIEIIDKPNGGLSSARNAAYPQIRGKYTLFVDSDDWLELDLCEKVHRKAEETNAPMTVFFYQRENISDVHPQYKNITPHGKTTVEEKSQILDFHAAWSKLWRTDFLLDNQLYFPEGLTFEDQLVNWLAVTLADKISVIPERLYHYRYHANSIVATKGEHTMHVVPIYKKVYEYLLESGHYAAYRSRFISGKLNMWYCHYHLLPASMKPKFAAMIRDALNDDDRGFYRTAPQELMPEENRLFYEMIDGGSKEMVKYHVWQVIDPIVKMPERFVRRWIVKPFKKIMKAA